VFLREFTISVSYLDKYGRVRAFTHRPSEKSAEFGVIRQAQKVQEDPKTSPRITVSEARRDHAPSELHQEF
jgi:hypothetical protein